MTLHLPTLLLLDIYVLTLLGGLMLHAWWRSANEPTLGYMAGMLLLAALGALVISLRGIGVDGLSMVFSNLLMRLATGMGWAAMRVFVGRRPWWPGVIGGALLWGLLCLWPYFHESLTLRVIVGTLTSVVYTALAIWELWIARRQVGASVAPAIGMLSFHALFCIGLMLLYRGQTIEPTWASEGGGFLIWRLLENFLISIGIAFVTLAMVRERAEQRYRVVSERDPLTDIGNRRAFTETAVARLARCATEGRPAALLLCDLDHFKRVNDGHGHAMGDTVLIAFGQVLALGIRQHDVCGRIGGEEFACLLPGADPAVAVQVAERIRQKCGELHFEERVSISVSIGVASAERVGYDLSRLLASADRALYQAKANGRDRVELFGG